MRNKSVARNLIVISIYQVLSVVLGFYVPKVFLEYCGSNTYGLISSITNFMGYISVLQVGVGAVVNAALYKPLADNDIEKLSVVVATARKFFRKIAYISIAYIIVLTYVFAVYLGKEFDLNLTIPLVIGIGAGMFIQYYFGIINQMLLTADQKAYIDSITQTICLVLNAIVIVVLVRHKLPVALIKIFSVIVYAIRPIALNLYVNTHYRIDYKVDADPSLMRQRWYAMGQAVAFYVHSKADVFLLTLFKSFGDVAVYSVYALITTSLTKIVQIIDTSVQAAFGNVFAKKENELLSQRFGQYSTIMHIVSSMVFTTAIVSSVSFVLIYTRKVQDYNYNTPWFSVFILLAEMAYCLRLPYSMMIAVSGQYKETMRGAYIEAICNIILSIIGYLSLGLVGIAIGTLVAMIYRTVDYVLFLNKHILYLKPRIVIKRYITTITSIIISYIATGWIYRCFMINSFIKWIGYSLIAFSIICVINLAINCILYRDDIVYAFSVCSNLIKKRKA